jgi:oxygen-independent coproporphyrinogen-3 oxidase
VTASSGSFGVYVHVPFCTRTCPYCDFYQVRPSGDREVRFVDVLLREAELARRELAAGELGEPVPPADTMYWGGGTPSLLSAASIRRLARGLADVLGIARDAEFTVEANPAEVPPTTLEALREVGANRLSLGIQSFQPDRLRFLGRWHDAADNRRALQDARAAGFGNVSLDLIAGLPAAFPTSGFRADVEEAVALAPEHLSVYGLTIEARTVFGRRRDRGDLEALDGDAAADEYLWCAGRLRAAGFEHYETSSFARPGKRSRHNARYWAGGEYLGLGPAAHSLLRGRRRANVRSLERWAAAVEAGTPRHELDEPADPSSRYAEAVYLGLRAAEGLPLRALRGEPRRVEELRRGLLAGGLAVETPDRLVLTDRGHLLLDEIAARLLVLAADAAGRRPAVGAPSGGAASEAAGEPPAIA